jgi:clan AA aspartic protease (TIGR02281 family)
MLKPLILFIIIFVAGLGVGWLLRDLAPQPAEEKATMPVDVPLNVAEPNVQLLFDEGRLLELVERSHGDARLIARLSQGSTSLKTQQLLRLYIETYGESLFMLVRLARVEKANQDFEAALLLMSRADLLAKTIAEQQMVSQLLNEIASAYAKVLLATENFQAVDDLYERITFSMPEQAQYYLKLGQLRIRLGNYDSALAPLSQIENHMEFGAQARELITQTQVDEVQTSLDVLPLSGNGNQFVVEAMVNSHISVSLLIDTGAAMTIIDERVLNEMGYSLNGSRPVLFSTANGVVEAPVVSIDQLTLGGVSMGPLSVGALPLSMKNGVDGLLGMNFLKRYDFRIDQDRRELHLNSER